MSEDTKKVPYLRAVSKAPARSTVPEELFESATWQRTLFVTNNENLLAFLELSRIYETEFLEVLVRARARSIVDLRLAPRFDVGNLNRKLVFSLFSQAGSEYIDMSGELGVRDKRDANLNPGILVEHLRRVLKRNGPALDGPLIFLVDPAQFVEGYVTALAAVLHSSKPDGWEVLRVPVTSSTDPISRTERNLVFISHAQPQDNDFAKWLGIQLTLHGYQVWSDVTKLIGGEYFWTSIEQAIRNHSAKVVVALSQVSQEKPGVLDEISCALSVERSESLTEFVLPVRIDDTPFDRVLANLARKNIIDFHGNWARGLSALLSVLQRDHVPKANQDGLLHLSDWTRKHSQAAATISQVAEKLVSNWLPIEALPSHVVLGPIGASNSVVLTPSFSLGNRLGRFAQRSDANLQTGSIEGLTDDFLNGNNRAELSAAESQKKIVGLLRECWDAQAKAKGLLPYPMASGALAWYAPIGLINGDRVSFRDAKGKTRTKWLVGRSEKRNVHWHYAVEMKPVLGRVRRFILISHVVFTNDGHSTIIPKERMHTMRRQFCKSWWNDRWRDLNLAFVAWLSGGRTWECGAPGLLVSANPLVFRSPVSLSTSQDKFDEMIEEMEWEDLDSGDVDTDSEEPDDDLSLRDDFVDD